MIRLLLFVLLLVVTMRPASGAGSPVYVQLIVRADDHLHFDITTAKMRYAGSLAKTLQAKYPNLNVSVLFLFSGASADYCQQFDNADGCVKFIKGLKSSGLAEVGYSGEYEPVESEWPRPNFRKAKSGQDRWLARMEPLEWFLTEFKEPRKGEVDPSKSGGLKKTQEVFGEVAFITSVTREIGGDPELAHLLLRMNPTAILEGFPPATHPTARNLNGYGGSVNGIHKILSSVPDTIPELFWQNGYLHMSENSGAVARTLIAADGLEKLKEDLGKLDRSKPHIVRLELANDRHFYKPEFLKVNPVPLKYAYANPKPARAPFEMILAEQEAKASLASEQALVEWLAGQFFVDNPGSRFNSCANLRKRARSESGKEIPMALVEDAARDLLKNWKGLYAADFATAGGRYFSNAEMFQLMVRALAARHASGSWPSSVLLGPIYGPLGMTAENGPNVGTVRVASILAKAAELAPALSDGTWSPLPRNVVPAIVTVDGTPLNAGQFLKMMAHVVSGVTQSELRVEMNNCYTNIGLIYQAGYRLSSETGSSWTLKPAPLSPD